MAPHILPMRQRSIPNYLEAEDKIQLRIFMEAIQRRTRLNITFYDFQQEGSKWVCWYDIPREHELEEAQDGEEKG